MHWSAFTGHRICPQLHALNKKSKRLSFEALQSLHYTSGPSTSLSIKAMHSNVLGILMIVKATAKASPTSIRNQQDMGVFRMDVFAGFILIMCGIFLHPLMPGTTTDTNCLLFGVHSGTTLLSLETCNEYQTCFFYHFYYSDLTFFEFIAFCASLGNNSLLH